MVLESCLAVQSCVKREDRRGLSTHPWGVPVLRISVADVFLPTLTTWGRPVRKSRILRLVMSFEGTMVLDAELLSMNSILT